VEKGAVIQAEFHLDLTSLKVQFQIIKGRNPSIVSKGICKEVVVTTGLNKIVHHRKIMVLQG
jgi:hypothetical protein